MSEDGPQYRMLCVVCLEPVTDLNARRTITLGTGPDTAWFAGMVGLCENHQNVRDHMTPFLHRAAEIHDAVVGGRGDIVGPST